FLTMASTTITGPAKPKNDPQIRRSSGDMSPDCLRRRLISLNAITENPTAMANAKRGRRLGGAAWLDLLVESPALGDRVRNQPFERRILRLRHVPHLDMPQFLSRTSQQAGRIIEGGAVVETE